jgi:hypothetical protein
VELVQDFTPAGYGRALPAGALAVLVRVEPSGRARIDFGRDGLFEVPLDKTDLVARANAVRLGQDGKLAPNLVHAIGPRLFDPAQSHLAVLRFATTFAPTGFLCVFAEPEAALAGALSPLRGRHGVMSVLVPQGGRSGLETRERLRTLDWPVPFVMDGFAAGTTRSLLPDGITPPAVVLLTPEGRVVFQTAWKPGAEQAVATAIDDAFGGI